jgi:hypothetical protein
VFLTQTMGSAATDAVLVDLRRLVYGALVPSSLSSSG